MATKRCIQYRNATWPVPAAAGNQDHRGKIPLLKNVFGSGSRKLDPSDRSLARVFVQRADMARDQRRYREAAVLYEEAMRLGRTPGPLHVQAGHMYKEAGEMAAAERHYMQAMALMPSDADLALQMGHFFKVNGRLRDAASQYRRAAEVKRDWQVPLTELANLRGMGWMGGGERGPELALSSEQHDELAAAALERAATSETLVPEIMPLPLPETLHRHGESIHIRRIGRRERTFWGNEITLRGVEAIRGVCISAEPIVEMQILLNGLAIHRGPTQPFPIRNELQNFTLRKHVFNVWLDLADHRPGRYALEIRFRDISDSQDMTEGRRVFRETVVIAEPFPEPSFQGDSAWTPATNPDDSRSVEEQINARPSIVSHAKQSLFAAPPRNVLVLRTDQLGDVVVSVPAMRRLRELLPDARIVGLFTSANVDLARTLGVFDEVIVVDFPDEREVQRKRVMTRENQEALREKLAAYEFDIAIDLAPATQSRPLLLLSGAPFLMGMRDRTWPYITAGFDLSVYDPVGRTEVFPASSKTMAFIEGLGLMLKSPAKVIRRPEVGRDRLSVLGILDDEKYVILHAGARVVFSRWGHYAELARRVLAQTPHKVVMLSEDPGTRAGLSADLLNNPRFQLLERRLAFDDFDALLSHCACFVGNDSGPKHLASLRGANVVSLHPARTHWGEWAQEQTGVAIHRQLPCGGCQIYDDPEECGKDYACITRISVDEVWGAMAAYL